MPTYDYVCDGCGHSFEHFQTMTSDPLTDCPECREARLRRLIGAGAALIFKGSGFYITDYKKSSSPEAKVEKAKEASKSVKESSKSDSKPSTSSQVA